MKCHCNSCLNGTCSVGNDGLCLAQISLASDGKSIDKIYGCFNQTRNLIRNLICDKNLTSPLPTITRCCISGDFCNRAPNLMPSVEEVARTIFRGHQITVHYDERLDGVDPSPSERLSVGQYQHQREGSLLVGMNNLLYPASTPAPAPETVQTDFINASKSLTTMFMISTGLFILLILVMAWTQLPKLRQRDRVRGEPSPLPPFYPPGIIRGDTMSMHSGSGRLSNPIFPIPASPRGRSQPTSSGDSLTDRGLDRVEMDQKFEPVGMEHPDPLLMGPYMTSRDKMTHAFQMTAGSGFMTDRFEFSESSVFETERPFMTQGRISHEIDLVKIVGRGCYGVVWHARHKGVDLGVKIFSVQGQPSWEREADIYRTNMLRHKNILNFITTDTRMESGLIFYWLITEYYPMGSLFDFLHEQHLLMADAVRMAYSIASGLAHLHTEIFGTRRKPAIAHRDMKSKNILLKSDGSCVLADLGMAVRYSSLTGIVDTPSTTRLGTRRYLAPELLQSQFNLMDFEAVKAADMYSCGLVLWEILRRSAMLNPDNPHECFPDDSESSHPAASRDGSLDDIEDLAPDGPGNNQPNPQVDGQREQVPRQPRQPGHFELRSSHAMIVDAYEMPYERYVADNPTTAEMREIVVKQKFRPIISPRWKHFNPMREFMGLFVECWDERPKMRLTAARLKKSLAAISLHNFGIDLEFE